MARARVVINKAIPFRGGLEQFSNGYWLTPDGDGLSDAQWIALIDAIKAWEVTAHSNVVQFLSGYGSVAGGTTKHIRTLTGNGAATGTSSAEFHPETCVLLQAPVARGRTLAKYIHIGKGAGGTGDSASYYASMTCFGTGANVLTDGTMPNGAKVCAPNGDVPTGPFRPDTYMRTHQLKAGKKRPNP